MLLNVNFKRTYTTQVFEFTIDSEWTIENFLIQSKIYLSDMTQINFNKIEIIEAGLKEQEDAEPLDSSTNLLEKFKSKFKISAYNKPVFYFRIKYPIFLNSGIECPICLNEARGILTLECSHKICTRCYNHMSSHQLSLCALCRHECII